MLQLLPDWLPAQCDRVDHQYAMSGTEPKSNDAGEELHALIVSPCHLVMFACFWLRVSLQVWQNAALQELDLCSQALFQKWLTQLQAGLLADLAA